jgi:hypothetical protein
MSEILILIYKKWVEKMLQIKLSASKPNPQITELCKGWHCFQTEKNVPLSYFSGYKYEKNLLQNKMQHNYKINK